MNRTTWTKLGLLQKKGTAAQSGCFSVSYRCSFVIRVDKNWEGDKPILKDIFFVSVLIDLS